VLQRKLKIYVDLDDVLSSTVPAFLSLAKEQFGRDLAYEDMRSFDMAKSLNLSSDEYRQFMECAHSPEVLAKIPPVDNAVAVIQHWQQMGYHIVVATGRPQHTAECTAQWLSDNGFVGLELLFVNKYQAITPSDWVPSDQAVPLESIAFREFDFVIEDSPTTADFLFRNVSGQVLLLRRPWNEHLAISTAGLITVSNWSEIHMVVERLSRNKFTAIAPN
jgi:uncharacterized HAD superfamily protein